MITNEAEFLSNLTSGWPENQSLLYRICLDPEALQIFTTTFETSYPALIAKSQQFVARIQRANNPQRIELQHPVQLEVNLFPPHSEPSFFLWRWLIRGLGYLVSACFLRRSAIEQEREICLPLLNCTTYKRNIQVRNKVISSRSFFVPAADGLGDLHTFEIGGDGNFSSEKPWILYLPTADGHYMSQIDLLSAENFDLNKYNVAAFNLRGSHLSEGWYANSYEVMQDVILQVNRILDKGVPPHRIIIAGHCYGGSLASMVAEYFDSREIRLGLFSDRAPSGIDEVTEGYLETMGSATGHRTTMIGKIVAFIIAPIVEFFLWLTDFNLPAAPAYAKFPEERKAHLCLRSAKEKRENSPDDNVIAHRVSMHKKIKPLMLDASGNLNLTPEQKAKRKQSKFVYPGSNNRNGDEARYLGHFLPLRSLRQTHGKLNGREYFTQFADRISAAPSATRRS
jgi:pimeloyl-ACP methyl ester carboxylesterase